MNFSTQGHPTAQQYANRMMNSNGSEEGALDDSGEILLDDMTIDDVDTKKKVVPILTKKGKLLIALIIVGGAFYYIWKKNKDKKEAVQQPESNQSTQPAETQTQKASEPVQSVSNEEGISEE